MEVGGACLCEAVRFRVSSPSKWCAHCHCTMCQRAHGAAFVTWIGYVEEDVEILDADENLTWFSSSEQGERGFCNQCGSMMFFRSTRWPGELHITRASVAGEIDRAPQAHAHYDTHVPWLQLGDDLPRRP